MEEGEVGWGAAEQFLEEHGGVGALDLEAEGLARLVGIGDRPLVALEGDGGTAGRGVELDPVMDGGAADQLERTVLQVEEDDVAADVPRGGDGDVLLGLPGLEALAGVDAELAEEGEGIGTTQEQVRHVAGEVEEADGIPPGVWFVLLVGELRGDDRVDPGAGRVVVEQLLHARCALQYLLQRARCFAGHGTLLSLMSVTG